MFATLPDGVADRLRESLPLLRLGCREERGALDVLFDTTEDDIDAFVAGIREELHRAA